jgi:ACR3 family arsenite transporter
MALAAWSWWTVLIFWLGYGAARLWRFSYEDAAPTAMIGASNHFEVAIATATMLFGLSSGAALATGGWRPY